VKRAILGFHRDAEDDRVADLACGHEARCVSPQSGGPQDTRHAGVGSELECPRCDLRELPEGFVAYRRTPDFDARAVPDALRSRHSTKPGVWARIHVSAGRLRYRTHAPFDDEALLTPGAVGIVLPEVQHEVEPLGEVRFHVEFYRREKTR
jgi:tellurite methyltransferase